MQPLATTGTQPRPRLSLHPKRQEDEVAAQSSGADKSQAGPGSREQAGTGFEWDGNPGLCMNS